MGRRLRAATGLAVGVVAVCVVAVAGPAAAEGDETLGVPGVEVASGSGIAAGGVGTYGTGGGTIEVTVPDGAEVRQVLLYWEGQTPAGVAPDDTITVGGTEVGGDPLSTAPIDFYPRQGAMVRSSAFRADITDLDLVGPGANRVEVGGLAFPVGGLDVADGAGIVVVYDDGEDVAIDLRDGVDVAYLRFGEPRRSTTAQTYEFAPSVEDRVATFTAFATSAYDATGVRPNAVRVVIGDAEQVIENPFTSADGREWDTLQTGVEIPAGVTSFTVQALSHDDGVNNPASLSWVLGAFTIEAPVIPPASTTTSTAPAPAPSAPPASAPPATAPPATAPPATEPPATTTTVPRTTTPTTTAGGDLPRTGAGSTGPLLRAGAGLVALGAGALVAVRRLRVSPGRPR